MFIMFMVFTKMFYFGSSLSYKIYSWSMKGFNSLRMVSYSYVGMEEGGYVTVSISICAIISAAWSLSRPS